MDGLSHLDEQGRARMVDVGDKAITRRRAVAEAVVELGKAAMAALRSGETPKGDVLATARIAGIQAAKRTSDLIPLCHPLPIDQVTIEFTLDGTRIRVEARVSVEAKTGVEMEALTAASVAALTVYDMLKAISHEIEIGPVRLLEKSGGRSGEWRRD